MKKIVVFSVLLALLSAAVFADDEDSGWKVGFSASLTRDFVYTTKASGESEYTVKPATGDSTTETHKLGDYIKGSSNLNTYTDGLRPDNRLIVSLSNSGEHHKIYIDAKLDDTWLAGTGPSLMGIINGQNADWEFSGNTGASGAPVVFDGKVGSGRYGGWVSANEIWDDWIQDGGTNFFGVWKKDGFQASDNISTADIDGGVWGAVYAVGATFGNFRLALGSTLSDFTTGPHNEVASASKAKAAFILSGKELGPLAFDLFYAVNGDDKNTAVRGAGGGKWRNLLGAYIGLNIVENLGLSLGYTANFVQDEKYQEADKDGNWVTYDNTYPFWSGIDIKASFNGIEKLGISFNNNISFASVKSEVTPEPPDNTGYNRIFGLDGTTPLNVAKDTSQSQSWFAYYARLAVKYSLSDNLGVTLALGNLLTVYSTEYKDDSTSGVSLSGTGKDTKDELHASIHAEYSAGSVTVGLGFNLGVDSKAFESEDKGSGGGQSASATFKGSQNTVTFSVPIFFKVSI